MGGRGGHRPGGDRGAQPDVPVKQPPSIRYLDNTHVIVTEPYVVTTSVGVVSIDVGFVSDGASIPERVTSLLGLNRFSGCVIRAALVHDALYAAELVPRDVADGVFYDLLIADGVHPDKARAMCEAVDRAGGAVWKLHTAESKAAARRLVRLEGR